MSAQCHLIICQHSVTFITTSYYFLGNSIAEANRYVKALEDCGFRMESHGEALLLHLGLSSDELIGLRRQHEGNIATSMTVGIDKIMTKRDLTWENVIDGVRRSEPTTAEKMLHTTT